MSAKLTINHGRVGILAALLLTMALSGCKHKDKEDPKPTANLKMMSTGIMMYRRAYNDWPDTLDQIVSIIAGNSDTKMLLTNPITGDNPGYEYIKPAADADPATTIVMYQLSGGKRDTSLPVLYADYKVNKIAP